MNDNLRIKNHLREEIKKILPLNFEAEIRSALSVVPDAHLRGLSEVRIVYDPPLTKDDYKYAAGLYYGDREGAASPYVLICTKNLFNGCPKGIPLLSSFACRMSLRKTLYHEIAHHYQRINHGIKREQWETDAKKYSVKMQLAKYRQNPLGKILLFIVSLFKTLLSPFR